MFLLSFFEEFLLFLFQEFDFSIFKKFLLSFFGEFLFLFLFFFKKNNSPFFLSKIFLHSFRNFWYLFNMHPLFFKKKVKYWTKNLQILGARNFIIQPFTFSEKINSIDLFEWNLKYFKQKTIFFFRMNDTFFYIGGKSWQWTFATPENNITQLNSKQYTVTFFTRRLTLS